MRILYMGTPDFAVPTLAELLNRGHEIVGVVTQPDKPQGRHMTLTPPPVKKYALEKGIKVYQPETLKNNAFKEDIEFLSSQGVDRVQGFYYARPMDETHLLEFYNSL